MGYELNKLMRQFGVTTPGMAAYSGTAAPVAPVEPVKGGGLSDEAYNEAMDKYRREAASYEANKVPQQAAADADRATYDQYRQGYLNRVMNTPQYLDAQYNTGNRPVSAGMQFATAPGGIGAQRYNQNIRDWVAGNPNATADAVRAAQARYGISNQDVYDATGSYWGNQMSSPRYAGYTPIVPALPAITPPTMKLPVTDYNVWGSGGDSGSSAGGDSGSSAGSAAGDSSGGVGGGNAGSDGSAADGTGDGGPGGVGAWAKGGSVHTLAHKYQVGGAVRRFQVGGIEGEPDERMPMPAVVGRPMEPAAPEPVTASPAARPVTPPAAAATPVSPAANDLMSMLQRYGVGESVYGPELKAARERVTTEDAAFQKMIADAMKPDGTAPDKSEMYFRLAAAFGAPTKTGHFAENLGMVGKELGEYAKDVRAAKKADRALQLQLGLEAQKLKAQGAREELGTLRTLTAQEMQDKRALVAEYIKSGRPQSEAGKAAVDAGLQQGTPQFTEFVNKYIDDKIRSGNMLKEAMVAISAGQLAVAQGREQRQTAAAAKLTPGEMKLKTETEDRVQTLDGAMKDLARAFDLNKDSFDTTLKDTVVRTALQETGSKDPKVVNTRELENLLKSSMISSAADKMKGVLSDSDIKLLQSVSGLDAKSREERTRVLKNAYRALRNNLGVQQKRLNEISQGLYRDVSAPSTGGELD